jgi:cytochrome c biogenesis protein CcdA/thiol-disulfide isomerase/thioredoxin
MGILIAFAFAAGVVSVLSPCILPVLPILLSGTAGGRARPVGIIAGFTASFTVFTLTLSSIVRALGIPPDLMRLLAAGTVAAFGLVMVVPALKERFSAALSAVASATASASAARPAGTGKRAPGFAGGLAVGASLGLAWTPCVGPIMASVISLSLSGRVGAESALVAFAYSAGTALPLFLAMLGGRALLGRLPFLTRNAESVQRAFGVLMIATAVGLFTGADRAFQSWVLDVFPQYGAGLTALEERASVRSALDDRLGLTGTEAPGTAAEAGGDGGPDPLALGSGVWINSPPLALRELRGKVVLVDFWTYSCINCLRTLPYLRAWHREYEEAGLVIVGVHTPEFAFERSEANVRRAVASLGVAWPVAMDNDYGIWNAYANRYWPAHYLYGRDGKLVRTHYGEGEYAETEAAIRDLLGIDAAASSASAAASDVGESQDRTPETYLGYARGERFSSPEDPAEDRPARYTVPEILGPDRWAFGGEWTIGAEGSASGPGATLAFRFRGERVYLVAVPSGGRARARLTVDGVPVDGGDARNGEFLIDEDRLYTLLDGYAPAGGLLRIEFIDPVEVYAFTFG